MVAVDSAQPWRVGRWLARTEAGQRFPAMLPMLLYDWLLAHRDGPDSGAIEIKSGRLADAAMIVSATTSSKTLRGTPCR